MSNGGIVIKIGSGGGVDTTARNAIAALQNQKGQPEGIATLDSSGKVPLEQVPEGIGSGGIDTEARASIAQLESQVNEMAKLATSYGVVPDAKYFNEADKKWYADATYTTPATDNTVALQNALDAAAGSKLIIPPCCGIKGTVYVRSNTIVDGLGIGEIILLDGFSLDPHFWREGKNDFYPMVVTESGSSHITIKDLIITGDRSALFQGRLHGFTFFEMEDGYADNVKIRYCNYFPVQNTPDYSGICIATMRSTNVRITGGKYEYGGYECIRVGDLSKNVVVDGVFIGKGWRTGFQILRGCENVKFINNTIIQGDLDNCDREGAITLHSAPDMPIKNILIDGNYIEATTTTSDGDGLCAISFIDKYKEGIKISNNKIIANNNGMNIKGDTKIYNNEVYCGHHGITLGNIDNIKIKDNTIMAVDNCIWSYGNIQLLNIENNKLNSTAGRGINSTGDYAVNIVGNEIVAAEYPIYISGKNILSAKISNNHLLKSNTEHGIYFDCRSMPQMIDDGVEIKNNKITPASNKDGILISAKMRRPIITENVVTQGSNGIRTLTDVDYAIVKNNDFARTKNGVGAMTGTNNVISDNLVPVV